VQYYFKIEKSAFLLQISGQPGTIIKSQQQLLLYGLSYKFFDARAPL